MTTQRSQKRTDNAHAVPVRCVHRRSVSYALVVLVGGGRGPEHQNEALAPW